MGPIMGSNVLELLQILELSAEPYDRNRMDKINFDNMDTFSLHLVVGISYILEVKHLFIYSDIYYYSMIWGTDYSFITIHY